MEVFSTPLFRSSENQAETMRKNGPMTVLKRKPFVDRSVNSNTPNIDKSAKGAHAQKLQTITPGKQFIPDFDAHEPLLSYKKDDFQYGMLSKSIQDRSINKTQVFDRSPKVAHSLKLKLTNTPGKDLIPGDLDANDLMFSYKLEDNYEFDMPCKPNVLGGTEGIIKLVWNYCNGNYVTPPPSPIRSSSPEITPVYLDVPNFPTYQKESGDVVFESISEVDCPPFDCIY